jgi:hypothetical protein
MDLKDKMLQALEDCKAGKISVEEAKRIMIVDARAEQEAMKKQLLDLIPWSDDGEVLNKN